MSHLLGSHIWRRPATISSESNIVRISKIWVMPPVGRGSAGMDIKIKKAIAKLFSAKISLKPWIDFRRLSFCQLASCSLNGLLFMVIIN